MKIRIKESTIRMRLSSKDVKKLHKTGKIVCECKFGSSSSFKYSIVAKTEGNTDYICVYMKKNHIRVELSATDVKEWYKTDLEGFDARMDNGTKDGLYLLIEKDWQCLTPRSEDEKDLYINPNA